MPRCLLALLSFSFLVWPGCSVTSRRVAPVAWRPPLQESVAASSPKKSSLVQPVGFQQASTDTAVANASAAGPGVAQLPHDELATDEAASDLVPETYSLEELESLALAHNPAIRAAEATAGIAAGWYQQVGTSPNPTVGYFGQQLADRGTDQHGFFVEQEFIRGGKLALNQAVLSHTHQAQQDAVEVQRLRVLTDVRTRFFEALAAQRQREATTEFAKLARQGLEVAQQRQAAQEGTLVETLQAQTQLSEVNLAAERAELAFRGAWQELAAIAGISDATPAKLEDELPISSQAPDWEMTYTEVSAHSPELAAARALVCEKQSLVRRQQVQATPNLTAQLGAGHDESTNHGMINLQFSAPLPINNLNCGNLSAAQQAYVRACENLKRIEQSLRARLARTAQEFDTALATVRKYQTEILPQTRQSWELAETGYQAGELDFLQVLIVRRTYYDAQLKSIAAQGQLAQAAAKVDGLLLSGGLVEPDNYTDGDGLRGASLGGQ